MKKIKVKTGDVFQIPIKDNSICFGQVIENKSGSLRVATFDTLYQSADMPTVQQIFTNKIILLTKTMDAKIYFGDWKVYLNTSIIDENLPKPCFKLGLDPLYITNFEGVRIRIAKKEEKILFDYAFSVSPIIIQNAMQAYFKVKDWDVKFDKLTYDYCIKKSILA